MPASRVLWIWLAVLVLARALLAFMPSMWGWGVNVQRFVDPSLAWFSWALMALALVPAFAKRGVAPMEKAGDRIARSRWAYAVLGLLGAALAWLMPDRVWFLGDFLIRMGNVEAGSLHTSFTQALPLDRWLHGSLLSFARGSAESANLALRALGAIEAGLLAALAVAFVRALRLTGIFAALAAGIVFFGGYLTMFTGLGKPASELCLATVALATFGVRAIDQRSSLLPCGLVMAGALLLHRSGVLLLPAWMFAVVLARRGSKRPVDVLGIGLPLLAGIFMIPRVVAIATGYDIEHHAGSLSLRQMVDLENLVLALSPLAIITPLLIVLRGRRMWERGDARLLVVLALAFLPALSLIHPQQGIFRDWDVFAPAGVASSVLAAFVVVETVAATPNRTWVGVSALALVVVSSIQWLALNHDQTRGLAQIFQPTDAFLLLDGNTCRIDLAFELSRTLEFVAAPELDGRQP